MVNWVLWRGRGQLLLPDGHCGCMYVPEFQMGIDEQMFLSFVSFVIGELSVWLSLIDSFILSFL